MVNHVFRTFGGRWPPTTGEEPTETYNRLKTLVNKIKSYESTR
jgi:hypothetical protein